jgi:NAD(P)-dependent dehydrogenase (short-subunit alcohol dehydrogenase family)
MDSGGCLMAGRLQNKTALISGSTGIAAATGRLAASEGASVFHIALDAGECEGVFLGDLTRAENARDGVRECLRRFGRIDCLFNVAGISGRRFGDGPLHECSEEAWDRVLSTNVKSMFLLTRETLRAMLAQPPGENGLRGVILNMATTVVNSPEPLHFATHAYAASKGAVLAMTKAMAAYYAPHGIRVNAIAPGLVRTPMTLRAQESPEILTFMRRKQPLAEDLIPASDVARAAVFLMSDEARMTTGETLTVDAGWSVSS